MHPGTEGCGAWSCKDFRSRVSDHFTANQYGISLPRVGRNKGVRKETLSRRSPAAVLRVAFSSLLFGEAGFTVVTGLIRHLLPAR